MPFASNKDLPTHVKKYSTKIQSQWRQVFNSVFKSTGGSDSRAAKAANSVLKKRFKRKNSMEKNSREDYFSQLVDVWLGNLRG